MKILILTPGNPFDHKTWSGTNFRIKENLLSLGHEIIWHGMLPRASIYLRIFALTQKLITGKRYQWKHSFFHAKRIGKILKKRVKFDDFDVIFVIAGATESAFIETKRPIVYFSDATFQAMKDYASGFSDLTERSIHEGHTIEQTILNKAKHVIYPSTWATNSAITDYKIPPEKISLLKFGPNFSTMPSKKDLVFYDQHIDPKLLFIGNNWIRKGGPTAVETLRELRRAGIAATLTIVGCKPELTDSQHIKIIPFLDKKNQDDFNKLCTLYSQSTLFLLPTLNEAAGIVFAEAACFGLPSVSYCTGGVPDYVEDNITGKLLHPGATGKDFAFAIKNILCNVEKYSQMRIAARNKFETELNWDIWCIKCQKILNSVTKLI